jgi:hypothetical protein
MRHWFQRFLTHLINLTKLLTLVLVMVLGMLLLLLALNCLPFKTGQHGMTSLLTDGCDHTLGGSESGL